MDSVHISPVGDPRSVQTQLATSAALTTSMQPGSLVFTHHLGTFHHLLGRAASGQEEGSYMRMRGVLYSLPANPARFQVISQPIYHFLYSINKSSLSTYYVPGTIQSTEELTVNRT